VDDVALEEYDVDQRGNTYSCWIASQAGKNFVIRCKAEPLLESIALNVYTDGAIATSPIFQASLAAREHSIQGCPISADTVRPFAFSKVSLTDDETIAAAEQQLTNLGTIEIKIFRVAVLEISNFVSKELKLPNNSVIHERSKKMSMHHVTLQETVAGPTTKSATTILLDNAPFATFIFRYRPKEFLRAQGIIPIESDADPSRSSNNSQASPDGVPPQERKRKRRQRDVAGPTIEIDSDDDSAEQEIRNLRQQMLRMQATLDALQQRRGGPVKREFKCETAVMPLHVDSNGVIDLSDD